MKCLVTGGAGFVGSGLVRGLLERGDEVRVLDNLSTGVWGNLEPLAGDIEFLNQDIRDLDALQEATRGMEVVFHQAAMPSVPRSVDDPQTSFAVNAGGTLNVFLAARDQGVRRVVYAASSSAYGNTETLPKSEDMPVKPLSPYAADKAYGEHLTRVFLESYGLECVALRYFNVFGPRQRPDSAYAAVIPKFTDALLSGRQPVIYGDGLQSRDFTYIGNVVLANQLAAEASKEAAGRVINVGAGTRTSLLELLEIISGVVGISADPEFAPPRQGDVRDSQADLTLARALLGYEPLTGLPEGLEATVAWFRENRE